MDEGGFILDYVMPAGSSLASTGKVLDHVEQILRSTPEVESTSRRTGLQMGLAAVTESNYGDISVKLKDKRSRGIDEVIADIRKQVEKDEPQMDVEFTQVLQDNIGDLSNAPEPIQIKLFTPDPAILDDIETTTPAISNGRPYTVRVRLGEENTSVPGCDAQHSLQLQLRAHRFVRFNDHHHAAHRAEQIRRENLQRLVVVTARLEGTDLGTAVKQVQQRVQAMHLPPTVRVEYGGTCQEQQKSFAELIRVLLLALVLVFGVLLTEFRDVAAPAAILTSSVLSISGVVGALLITGTTFNVAASWA